MLLYEDFINEIEKPIKKNVIQINLKLTEEGVKKFKIIPTFKNLLYPNQINNLIIGDNLLTVNNTIFGKLKQVTLYDSDNMSVEKIDKK